MGIQLGELRERVRKINALLDDPQEGLMTWNTALGSQMNELIIKWGAHSEALGIGFVIYKPDDETMAVYLNDKYITTATHDSEGWAGMESVEEMVTEIAKVLKLSVETRYEDEPASIEEELEEQES